MSAQGYGSRLAKSDSPLSIAPAGHGPWSPYQCLGFHNSTINVAVIAANLDYDLKLTKYGKGHASFPFRFITKSHLPTTFRGNAANIGSRSVQ